MYEMAKSWLGSQDIFTGIVYEKQNIFWEFSSKL